LLALVCELFCRICRIYQTSSQLTVKFQGTYVLSICLYGISTSYSFIRTEVEKMTELEDKVRVEVGKVQDPETGQSFEEMQMIQSVKETEPGIVTVEFVPTSPFCPIAFKLSADLRDAAKTVPGLKKVVVLCRGHAMEQQINEMTNKE
jgi:metal-sulfur cluster biosynthetic enzyme